MTTGDGEPLSESEVFEVLENPRRRRLLEYLRDNDGRATLDELVDHVAAAENDVPPEEVTAQQRRRVHVSLTQAHVPKLDAAGIVDYHDDRKVVEWSDGARSVEPYMTPPTGGRRPWPVYYLLLSLAGVAAVALYRLDVPLLGDLSPLAISLGFVAALLGTALFHLASVVEGP